ncbi:hypothetical protein KC19_3G204400 [Ceratodon purpureus]|uniref:Uncharacterized protein n=1 Tax=Ceratodon purpureus TaxID=3225 RepID=A0A8T0IPI8_CERPU|nr:hypothetical protein KC19_3G204400 [Ceratodon purpureus]
MHPNPIPLPSHPPPLSLILSLSETLSLSLSLGTCNADRPIRSECGLTTPPRECAFRGSRSHRPHSHKRHLSSISFLTPTRMRQQSGNAREGRRGTARRDVALLGAGR